MIQKVAILIVNFNMPERTDQLCSAILDKVHYPFDLIVVDNGSNKTEPSKYTTIKLGKNRQTTGGWLAGLEKIQRGDYFAYWFWITSASYPENQGDILTPMVGAMKADSKMVGIHPSLTIQSTTSWGHLYNRGTNDLRRTWMIDNIASLYRAQWFDSIGRFDPELLYAWGIDLETCWKARRQRRSLWVDDRVQVEKVTNIGYQMGRMGMSASEREVRAGLNMEVILSRKYGENWWWRMTQEFVNDDWK